MKKFIQVYKSFSILEKSILLCFLLPPLGMLLLLVIGLQTLYTHWFINKRFIYSISSYFFLCLLISTLGAALLDRNGLYLLVSILILGYWGLYCRILGSERSQLFQRFRLIIIFGGVYSCVIGWISKWLVFPKAIDYLLGTVLFWDARPIHFNRLIGCAYNPNFNVYILLIAISFLFGSLLASIRKKHYKCLAWQLPIQLLLSYGVFLTGSRAGFATMISIYLLFIFRLNRVLFFTCSFIGLIFYKFLIYIMPRADSVIQASQKRVDIWKNSYNIWENHPFFGVTPIGFGREYFMQYNQYIPHAHNILLGMFAEYGTLGGLAFLILASVNIAKCIHLFFFKLNKKSLVNSFILGLPIILFTGIFDEPIFSPQIGFLTVVFLGCWDHYSKRIQYNIEISSLHRSIYGSTARIVVSSYTIFHYLKSKIISNKYNNL
ncbi:O-antigen ligase family protein [Arthrobacter citreus]|nr:O-antigen ligase family protein [Arthrobacter citreus]